MSHTLVSAQPAQERKTAGWVAFIACGALVFDGYDLTVYGTIMPTLLNDPSQLGALDPSTAGLLGSYAMLGVLVGALTCGAVGDWLGRRRLLLVSISWFSLGMLFTAFASSVMAFGILRFLSGLGLGAVLAVAGATMAEFAPANKRNLYNAIVYSGVPAGGVLAAGLGIILLEPLGWRGLFIIGAAPLVLVPIAFFKDPPNRRGGCSLAAAARRPSQLLVVRAPPWSTTPSWSPIRLRSNAPASPLCSHRAGASPPHSSGSCPSPASS